MKEVKRGSTWAVNHFYVLYKYDVMTYLRSRHQDEEILLTVYHETVIFTLNKLEGGDLEDYSGSILPYLKSVAWNLLRNLLRKQKVQVELPESLTEEENFLDQYLNEKKNIRMMAALEQALSNLGEKCQKLIELAFFTDKKYSNSDLSELLALSSANSVAVTKNKCLNSLKQFFHQEFRNYEK